MIHSTAIIHPSAQVADDVEIGPYSIIGEHVSIDSGTVVGPHAVINGHTEIGKGNRIFQFTTIGEANQDKKYGGEPTRTVIGDNNVIREYATIHRGTVQDVGVTTIGNNNLLMAYSHVAHDCLLKDNIIMANGGSLAGHVKVDDWAIVGGITGVHQFVHIGAHSFIGLRSIVRQDILPFVMYVEEAPRAINTEGLKRRGFTSEDIRSIRNAYKAIYRQGLTIEDAVSKLSDQKPVNPNVQLMLDFIAKSERGLAR
ncbi:MAG: acyl-ACP--UDP-N-acetylglucosamine O-acyltransferase [Gammaproteobacteria bacterium]|nr:acyl-ACP--UDP-N-acetylglucosamine O-acyltransferase [Gammaproteobacteria bacterium]MDH5628523.1 acyl-ACP--UDP-N-acetylglucosamine O-acyltransferase [Gammaproteobacteria bacterium]